MFDVKPKTSPKPTDCGATCLQMLLDFYGTEVDLETLIKDCNTDISGCTGKDILNAARKHGLAHIKAFKMDADELVRQDRPSIIWWKYNHWCVCCGRDEAGNVVICNPDRGRYRMKEETFACFYTGIGIFNGEPEDLPE